MHKARRATLAVAATLAAIGAWPLVLNAQTRSDVDLSGVGSISQPGTSSGIRDFQRYSSGVGGLRDSAGGASSNLLSRDTTRSGFEIQRTSPSDYPDALGLSSPEAPEGPSMSSVQRYTPTDSALSDFGDVNGGPAGIGQDALGAAFTYLRGFDRGDQDHTLQAGPEPITSLVPDSDGAYARYMRQAEEALREGRHHDAMSDYRMAHQLGRTAPESYLGMAHTRLAMSSGISYSSAAYNLAQALRYFPELPLVPLRPAEFFEDETRYAEIVSDLQMALDRDQHNVEAMLCLAYLRWFETDATAATRLLDNAARHGDEADSDLMEAVDTFREGIRRVRGEEDSAGTSE